MRIVSWNVRGMGSELKIAAIKRLIRSSRGNVCLLQESKLDMVNMNLVNKIWGIDNVNFRFVGAEGRPGGNR